MVSSLALREGQSVAMAGDHEIKIVSHKTRRAIVMEAFFRLCDN